ncbi:MAG: glucoamylase family protein [Solirubrobacteraceae bacterium]
MGPGTLLTFVPTFAGGMFEGLMANLVVPETTWGPHSFGLDDLRWAQVQVRYATDELAYPVWGMSPSSTADDTGGYGGFGVDGQAFGAGEPLAWCTTCATETTVTPYASAIALPVLPQEAHANLVTLRTLYPGLYTSDGGFYDAVNPVTGEVGHRRLVLDQSMIMAGIDDALDAGALQQHFAADPESWAARVYLGAERMSIG